MRAQQRAAVEVERILRIARGMMGGEVEGFEVVEVVFDILGHHDFEAQADEDFQHPLENLMNRMDMAAANFHPREGHVEQRLAERFLERGGLELLLQSHDARFEIALDLVDQLADRGPLFVRHLAHPTHDLSELAGAAEHAHADVLNLSFGGVVAELGDGALSYFLELVLHCWSSPDVFGECYPASNKRPCGTPHGLLVRTASEERESMRLCDRARSWRSAPAR